MIPNIKIENEEVIKEELDVPILINGESKNIKLVKLSSGQRREIIKRSLKINSTGQTMSSEVTDPLGIQIGILSAVIIDAPFDYSEKGLSRLPEDVVDYLYGQYNDWVKKKTIEG